MPSPSRLPAASSRTARLLAAIGAVTGIVFVATLVGLIAPSLGGRGLLAGIIVLCLVIAVLALLLWRQLQADDAHEPVAPTPSGKPVVDSTSMQRELESLRRMQDDLLKAKQEAEAAMMAKGEFLATMSHEIRTPLNGIVPLLDLLQSTPLQADQRDYLATAHQSSLELLRIVDDILDYSKLEASKLELESVGVNLRELVDSVAMLMESSANAKGLRLGVVIDPAVRLAVRGDPVRLRQIIVNLVSNAIKFTERGGVTIQIGKRGESRSHYEITFAVRDTGIGLSREAAEKLFRPFSQADASTTRMYGGTGLGLAICKRLVELMDGKIGVRSELGKGSTFWFNVPLQKALGDVRTRNDLVGVRALLLSGNEAFMRRASGLVGQLGMNHMQSNLAVDALSKLRLNAKKGERWAYEILLVDAGTVGNASAALVRNIRRDPTLDGVHILVAGNDENTMEVRGDERVTLLTPNFDERELREKVSNLLGVGAAPALGVAVPLLVASEPTPVAVAAPASMRSLHGRALLVEDNPVNARVASRLLSLLGIEAVLAGDGQAALDLLAREQFDIVLMDCQMPVMDGYTATRQRREDERQRGLMRMPIVAMTANAMIGDREKCLAAGMDDYLSKPLDRGALATTLARWLKAGEGEAKPVATSTPAPAPATAPVAAAHVRVVASGDAAQPALDTGIVQELIEVMGDGFADLVGAYVEDAPRLITRLGEAVMLQDFAGIAASAHPLKSSSANLGALGLSELAKRAEMAGRNQQAEGLERLPDAIRNEFGRVLAELARLGLSVH